MSKMTQIASFIFKATVAYVTALKSWETRVHCTACRQLNWLESHFLVGLSLFQAALLVSASPRQLVWPQSSLQLVSLGVTQAFLIYSQEGGV